MFKIKRVREHLEIYIDGKFFCSADNDREAESEIEEYLAKHPEV